MKPSVTIVGAGIVGLAMARSFALQGAQVKVYERSPKALGASIRNFGLVWPIAQPQGPLYERALKGRAIWRQLAEQAGFACDAVGSMQLAYRDDEAAVLEEFYGHSRALRSLQLLRADEAKLKTGAVLLPGLKCALLSQDEMVVDPREAIAQIASYLSSCGTRREWLGLASQWAKAEVRFNCHLQWCRVREFVPSIVPFGRAHQV
jgi:glycine/D-amino acid oxidase-like deaminating enzyme